MKEEAPADDPVEEGKEAAGDEEEEKAAVVRFEEDENDGSDQDEEEKPEKPRAITIPVVTRVSVNDYVRRASRCSKCTQPVTQYATMYKSREQVEKEKDDENDRIMEIVNLLKERQKRKVVRQIKNGEIDYDSKNNRLIYTDTKEEFVIDKDSDDEGGSEDEDDM